MWCIIMSEAVTVPNDFNSFRGIAYKGQTHIQRHTHTHTHTETRSRLSSLKFAFQTKNNPCFQIWGRHHKSPPSKKRWNKNEMSCTLTYVAVAELHNVIDQTGTSTLAASTPPQAGWVNHIAEVDRGRNISCTQPKAMNTKMGHHGTLLNKKWRSLSA